ncbi:MAG: GNAT family N-acetyltransferase [Caulobacteraceae bacterium]
MRALTEADLPELHRWYQTPELWDHLVGEFRSRAEREAIEYMRSWLTPTTTELRLAIELARSHRLVGMTAFTPIDPVAREAEFHIFLGNARDRGRGLGRAATAVMLAHGFRDRGLSRIHLRVRAGNAAARRLYEDLGFVILSARTADPVVMALSAEAYRRPQACSAR